jgi:hypothetical protein
VRNGGFFAWGKRRIEDDMTSFSTKEAVSPSILFVSIYSIGPI